MDHVLDELHIEKIDGVLLVWEFPPISWTQGSGLFLISMTHRWTCA